MRALGNFNENKAPDFECVDIRTVKQLDKVTRGIIRTVMNKCLEIRFFLECWKRADVVFFVKKRRNPE